MIGRVQKTPVKWKSNVHRQALSSKKRGHLLLLGKTLNKQAEAYLLSLGVCGAVVSTAITLAGAQDIVLGENLNLLDANSVHISLTKFGRKTSFVKRKGMTKVKVTIGKFEFLKDNFLLDIKSTGHIYETLPPLVRN